MKYRMNHIDTFEMTDIEIYTLVLNDTLRSYPMGFWDGVDGVTKAKKIFKHVIEDILQWSLEDIKDKSKTLIVDEYKLQGMISIVFDGSIFIAIGETFPELKDWADKEYREHDNSRYTDNELIEILQEKAKELNRIPKGIDMKNPSSAIYTRRFGSWEKSLMKGGLIEDIYEDVDFENNSKEAVLQNLKNLFVDKERVLEKDEVLAIYPEGLIKEYFGSYNKLEKIVNTSYTKEDLVRILKKKKGKLGRIPSGRDMKFPRAIVFIDKFGSWQKAIDKMEKS